MLRFLRLFFLTLRESFSKRGSSLPSLIAANETVSRFILSRRHFSLQPPRIKAEAYMPRQGEVSVFRTEGLREPQIWSIGSEIAQSAKRTLHARGDTVVHEVRQIGLDILKAEPPPRHANIVSWPENDKPRQKLIALQLAAAATLVLSE